MAQPGQTTIQLYSTTTTATTPSPSNLVSGELALNLTDKKLFTKDGSGNVIEMTPSPTNALAVGSGGTGATSAASARANLDALAATNPSYTGTLTGGTGVVNLGSGQFVKDASGNVMLGGTPAAWEASSAIDFGSTGVTAYSFGKRGIGNNCYYDGSNWRYKNSAGAGLLQMAAGVYQFNVAPSGTAGNPITFTQAMTLDASGNLNIATGVVGRSAANSGIAFTSSSILPATSTEAVDNTIFLGSASWRWSVVYAGTGTINTSDAREKTPVRVMAADEIEAAKALSKEIGVYQFLASVDAKGDKARHHIGMTVQRAIEIMRHYGLDPFSYGFICYDKWDEETKDHPAVEAREAVEAKDAVLDDEGNVIEPAVEAQPAIEAKDAWTEVTLKAGDRYSFRYDQLTLFIARGLHAEIEAMQTQIDAQNTAMQLLASRLAALEAAT